MAEQWLDQRGFLTNVYFSFSSKSNPPGVANSEIVSTFSRPILYPRGQYELALVSLKMVPAARLVVNTVPEPEERQLGPLFPDYTPPTTTEFNIIKEDQQALKFMANFTRALQENGYKVVYVIISNRGEALQIHIVIHHNNENPGTLLSLPTQLANLMGFKRPQFYPGTSLPEENMYDKIFQDIPVGTQFDIKYVTPTYKANILQVGVRRHLTYPVYNVKERTMAEFLEWLPGFLLK